MLRIKAWLVINDKFLKQCKNKQKYQVTYQYSTSRTLTINSKNIDYQRIIGHKN